MRKRGLCCRPMSVCPSSRWCIVSTWLKISSNFFLDPVAPSFEFFLPQAPYPNPRKPFQRGAKCTGWKKCNFRLKSPFTSATVSDRTSLLWNVNIKLYDADRSVSVPMTSSDLERRDARNHIFRRISFITLVPFDVERQNSAG